MHCTLQKQHCATVTTHILSNQGSAKRSHVDSPSLTSYQWNRHSHQRKNNRASHSSRQVAAGKWGTSVHIKCSLPNAQFYMKSARFLVGSHSRGAYTRAYGPSCHSLISAGVCKKSTYYKAIILYTNTIVHLGTISCRKASADNLISSILPPRRNKTTTSICHTPLSAQQHTNYCCATYSILLDSALQPPYSHVFCGHANPSNNTSIQGLASSAAPFLLCSPSPSILHATYP